MNIVPSIGFQVDLVSLLGTALVFVIGLLAFWIRRFISQSDINNKALLSQVATTQAQFNEFRLKMELQSEKTNEKLIEMKVMLDRKDQAFNDYEKRLARTEFEIEYLVRGRTFSSSTPPPPPKKKHAIEV